ncbi:hypothetical protein G9A89_004303 [Geosiphon pyriformis]|nr:hypothetical protein G9A89_004303 [Geosiphon pyriformis]
MEHQEVLYSTTTDVLNVLQGIATVIDVSAIFIPLINDITNLVHSIIELYRTAEHNKKICRLLSERVNIVQYTLEDTQIIGSLKEKDYMNFQKLITVISNIKIFVEQVSQLKGLRKFFNAHDIEEQYKSLTQEFDDLMKVLNFATTLQIQSLMERDNKSIKSDLADLNDYLKKIEGGIADGNQKISEKLDIILAMHLAYQKEKLSESVIYLGRIDRNKLTDPESSEQITKGKVQKKYYMGKIEVAVKIRLLSGNKAEDEKKNIMSQVAILKKLKDCPHIIHFYGVSEDENALLMVTGWAEFGTLTEYYKTYGPIEWLKRSEIATDIVRGLTFLHEVSILHHDIRSQNILIDQYHAAKIANFTLSRNIHDVTLVIKQTLETVRYLAPENLENNQSLYTTKCEIFSFGILLWEIAQEQIPYGEKGDIREIYEQVLKAHSLPFSLNVPPDWQKISWEATRHDPKMRPSLTEMFTALHKLLKLFKPQVSPRPGIMHTSNVSITSFTLNPNIPDPGNDDDLGIELDFAELSTVMPVEDAIKEYKDGNKIDAFKAFEKHANFGNLLAKYWVGYCLYHDNISQNPPQEKKDRMEKAAKYFKEAADRGKITGAQFRYGYCLWNGQGVPQDIESAIKYFELAAYNNITAMYNIGYIYYQGYNVMKDEKKGKRYLILAALKGQPKALEMCQKENIPLTENLD